MASCQISECLNNPEVYCKCSRNDLFFCEFHFPDHLVSCSYDHKIKHLVPKNLNNLSQLLAKIDDVRNGIARIQEKLENSIQKCEIKLKQALELKNKLAPELDAAIKACDIIEQLANKPIFEREYYTPLEYLIKTNDDVWEILEQIKPPRMEKIKPYEDKCKKWNFYSTTVCHLLNNYNSYCMFFEETKEANVFSLSYFDGENSGNIDSDKFEPHSRIMLISPYEVLMTGGFKKPKTCRIINLKSKTISEEADLNCERLWHCCAFIKGYPAVIGGRFKAQGTKSVEILKHEKWKEIAPLNYPRSSPAASTLFDKVYVYGGGFAIFEVFNEKLKAWHELKCNIAETPTVSVGLISLYNDFILVFGGVFNAKILYNDIKKADLTTGKVTPIISLKKEGKFSYGNHIIRRKFIKSFNSSEIIEFEIRQEISLLNQEFKPSFALSN